MPKLIRNRPLCAAVLLLSTAAAQAQTDVLPSIPRGDIAVLLKPVATGLAAPDYATFAPGDSSRLYVVEQNGLLRVIENGSLLAAPAMDIRSLVAPPLVVTNANDERGFLGLAFHPGFATPGSAGYQTLYTYGSQLIPAGGAPTYAAPNGAAQGYMNVVNEWKRVGGVVDPSSRREIISFGKNANNHNGGTIAFGPDNYLYLGLGDGGNARDVGPSHIEPGGNSQNLSTPLGKMLRFDPLRPTLTAGSADAVSGNGQYRIPVTNPFKAAGQVPNGLTVHGFGKDAAGELYALVTNTPANGTGGIVYQITAVPEPATWAMWALVAAVLLLSAKGRGFAPRQC